MIVRTLLIAAALLGGTAQAAESTDLCGANLQKLDDILAAAGKTSAYSLSYAGLAEAYDASQAEIRAVRESLRFE